MKRKNAFRAGMIAFMVSALFCATSAIQADDCSPCEPLCSPCEPQCDPCDSVCGSGNGTLWQAVFGAGPYYRPGRDLYGSPNGSRQDSVFGGSTGNLARTAAVAATATAVPNMIGDSSFSAGRTSVAGYYYLDPYNNGNYSIASYSPETQVPSLTSAITRLNVAENFNGEVQNQIYFDYRHFHNVGSYQDYDWNTNKGISKSINVDRYTIGFERKLSSVSSIEFRLPIVSQIDSTQIGDWTTGSGLTSPKSDTEIGNISLVFKKVLRRNHHWTHTIGLGLNLPTASDGNLIKKYSDNSGRVYEDSVQIKNQECRLLPYYALQWHPNRRTFGHIIAQVDVPLNRNEIIAHDDWNGNTNKGKLSDETLLRLNTSFGKWFYIDDRADFLNRFGAIFEAHYSVNLNSMNDRWVVADANGGYGIGSYAPRDKNGSIKRHVHVVDLVGGLPIQVGKTMITPSVAVPVTDARYFSTELSLQINRRF